ncbi:MAG: ABC transporter ATP-binding protein [Rhodospirillales bacterium]|mgnify:CR=1 FL=1|jgi:putative hydroxymethylpyrimidine transport system ATP-binding protein|nr:ABC transporter ATP-binding protein [Rhodospirillales bacterium]
MPSTETTSAISVNVHSGAVEFDGAVLFEELDVTLPQGRITCLLGTSGVGKSTLLRLISGLETGPSNGGVVLCSDGKPLSGRVALMAQRAFLLPWLNVVDNVLLGSRLRGERQSRDRAKEILADVGLADWANASPDTLSGGMRQRAALARTLMEDRPVVLMDEPFSGLDAITKVRLQNLAARMLKGRTVLLVTHDPLEALRLGDRIHVMAGRPARLDENPLEPEGAAPRDVDDPTVLEAQGVLLRRLAEAAR